MAKQRDWQKTKSNPHGYEPAAPGSRVRFHDPSYVRGRSGPVKRLADMSPERRAAMARLYGKGPPKSDQARRES